MKRAKKKSTEKQEEKLYYNNPKMESNKEIIKKR